MLKINLNDTRNDIFIFYKAHSSIFIRVSIAIVSVTRTAYLILIEIYVTVQVSIKAIEFYA